MTEMFGEAWSPMSVPDLAPDDDDDDFKKKQVITIYQHVFINRISNLHSFEKEAAVSRTKSNNSQDSVKGCLFL